MLHRYFERKPPFSKVNKSKAEFPDAISLLVLEDYALSRNTKAILVSKDSDWKEFIAGSQVLYHVDTLDQLFEHFQVAGNLQTSFSTFAIDEINQKSTYWWKAMFSAVADHVATSGWSVSKRSESMWMQYDSKLIGQRATEFMVDECSVKLGPVPDGCVLETQIKIEVDLYMHVEQYERVEIEHDLHDWYLQKIYEEEVSVSVVVPAFVTYIGSLEDRPARPNLKIDVSRREYEWLGSPSNPMQLELLDQNE